MPAQPSDIIPEHQAPISVPSGTPTQQKQSSKDQRDVKMVLDLLQKGKAAKKDISQDWDERWDFYNDDQWGRKNPRNKSNAVMNIIKVTIQSLLPILTDIQPGLDVLPEEPQDFQFAQILSQLTESWWEKKGLNHILIEVLMDAMIYDAGILKITWNPDKEMGIGDVDAKVVDPREIYLPKDASDFNRNCAWVIQLAKKPVGELRRKYPDKAKYITGSSDDTSKEKEAEQSIRKVTLVSPVDQEPTVVNRFPEGQSDLMKTETIAECWMDDEALIEYEEENKATGKKETKVKKKYPNGRVITILVDKKIKIGDSPNPYEHGKKPFVRFVDTILPRRFWGDGEVKPLMSIQKTLNKTLANIVNYMNFTSNPIWFVENGAGVDAKRITNSYGLVLRLNNDGINRIKRDIPPPLPQYIVNFYNILREAAETISGASDITQGRKPTGVTAAAGIEALQEAANTRVRLKERNMQVSLAQLGRMVISLMMQYYKQPRVARITGNGEWPEFFDFHITDTEDGKKQYNRRGYTFVSEEEGFVPNAETVQGQPSRGIFDVKVRAGTSLPFAKTQRANTALRLFDMGVIAEEALLDALDWPEKEKTLNELKEKQAEAAAAEGLPPEGGV